MSVWKKHPSTKVYDKIPENINEYDHVFMLDSISIQPDMGSSCSSRSSSAVIEINEEKAPLPEEEEDNNNNAIIEYVYPTFT